MSFKLRPPILAVHWGIGPNSTEREDIKIKQSSKENCTQSETTKDTNTDTETHGSLVLWSSICIPTAVLVIVGLVIIAILVKRRRANENEEDDETKETREDESSIPDHYADAPYTDNYYDSIK